MQPVLFRTLHLQKEEEITEPMIFTHYTAKQVNRLKTLLLRFGMKSMITVRESMI